MQFDQHEHNDDVIDFDTDCKCSTGLWWHQIFDSKHIYMSNIADGRCYYTKKMIYGDNDLTTNGISEI